MANLDYIFSAPGYCRIIPSGVMDNQRNLFPLAGPIIADGVKAIQKDIKNMAGHHEYSLGLLFNAYKEKGFVKPILDYDTFGFSSLYADSGGLQIVTAGSSVTPEIKRSIYQTQSVADFAMCFDEIPCRTIEGVQNTHRSRTSDKEFFPEQKKECAEKTAINIKEQIEYLDKIEAKSKVHYIIQGNTVSDMVEWFDDGFKFLDKSHHTRIGGLSMADTCMGNGQLESIDMLVSYHILMKKYGREVIKNHLHLLGVGSVSRLVPLLYMIESGFLPDDILYSFDSSTFSMGYVGGIFRHEDGGIIRSDSQVEMKIILENVFDYFNERVFSKINDNIDKDTLIEHLMVNIRSTSESINDISEELYPYARAMVPLTNVYSILSFVKKTKEYVDEMKLDNSPIGMLQYVHDLKDYSVWKREYSKFVKSKRIFRRQSSNIDSFFS
jgi:hypothetical protein